MTSCKSPQRYDVINSFIRSSLPVVFFLFLCFCSCIKILFSASMCSIESIWLMTQCSVVVNGTKPDVPRILGEHTQRLRLLKLIEWQLASAVLI